MRTPVAPSEDACRTTESVAVDSPRSQTKPRALNSSRRLSPLSDLLTVKLRGRTGAPALGAEGAQSLGARGAKQITPHGPLQRLLAGAAGMRFLHLRWHVVKDPKFQDSIAWISRCANCDLNVTVLGPPVNQGGSHFIDPGGATELRI